MGSLRPSFAGHHDAGRSCFFPLEQRALNFGHPERRMRPSDGLP